MLTRRRGKKNLGHYLISYINMPRVSILIGIHNGEKFLAECFTSIQAQEYSDYEIICVDDASTDNTSALLKNWQRTFGVERMTIITNATNYGLTRSLNIALRQAKGFYFARIDADDTWEKTKLQKQVAFLDTHPEYGIVGSNHVNVYKDQVPKKISLPETHEQIARKLFRRNPFAHSCVVGKTSLIQEQGGYNESIYYGQDYDLWLRCFPLTRFYNLQEYLCTRNVSDGISVKKQDAQMWQSIKTRAKYIRKYHYGIKNYFYLIEPLTVLLTPNFIKNIKRRYL